MKQWRREAFCLPNLITYFRLLLVPVFMLVYFCGWGWWALVIILISGLTDIADGFAARRLHMVTDIGIVADPVADKITQAAMVFCAAWDMPSLWALFGILVAKELLMLVWGILVLRRTGTVNSSKWYGKACAVVLYIGVAILVAIPGLSPGVADAITAICIGMILMSIILYSRWYVMFLHQHRKAEKTQIIETSIVSSRASTIALEVTIAILVVCAVVAFVFRKDITMETIVTYAPAKIWLAILVFMAIYAVKSLTVVVYLKIIYMAAGVVFSLPVAIAVNVIGTALEMTIPYLLGHFGGRRYMDMILQRQPRLQKIQQMQMKSDLWFSILSRGVGVLPADPLSIYLGASGMTYGTFLIGGVLGLLPSMICATVMGARANAPTSTGFVLSTVLFVLIQVAAAGGFVLWGKKRVDEGRKESDESSQ